MIQDCEIPYCGKHQGESHGESIQGYTAQYDFQRPLSDSLLHEPLGAVTKDTQQLKTNSTL